MRRTLQIVLLSTLWVGACKSADKPAGTQADPAANAANPANPAGSAGATAQAAGSAITPAAAAANLELETRGIALMQRMGDLFAADASDCEKLANDLATFLAENRGLLEQLVALEKTQSAADNAAFEARNRAVRDVVSAKMGPVLTACEANPNVQAALSAFPHN